MNNMKISFQEELFPFSMYKVILFQKELFYFLYMKSISIYELYDKIQ